MMAFTDSMAYTRNKIKACSIIGRSKNKNYAPNYHSTNDTIENLDFNNLWNCYRILIEFIKQVNENKVLI
jgi:aminopeptidase-like protein